MSSFTSKLYQNEQIEKIVKSRIRAEVESRLLAEKSMKKALKEAFEVKKELALMRRELKQQTGPEQYNQVEDEMQQKLVNMKKRIKAEKEERLAEQSEYMAKIEELENANEVSSMQGKHVGEEMKHIKKERDIAIIKCKRSTQQHNELNRKYKDVLASMADLQAQFDLQKSKTNKHMSSIGKTCKACSRNKKAAKEAIVKNEQLGDYLNTANERLVQANSDLDLLHDQLRGKDQLLLGLKTKVVDLEQTLQQQEQVTLMETKADAVLEDAITELKANKENLLEKLASMQDRLAIAEDKTELSDALHVSEMDKLLHQVEDLQDGTTNLKKQNNQHKMYISKLEIQVNENAQKVLAIEKALCSKGISLDMLLQTTK